MAAGESHRMRRGLLLEREEQGEPPAPVAKGYAAGAVSSAGFAAFFA